MTTAVTAAPRIRAKVPDGYEPDTLVSRVLGTSTFVWYMHAEDCNAPFADRTEGVECPGCVAVDCRWDACSGAVSVRYAGLSNNDADPQSLAVTARDIRGAFILAIETAWASKLHPGLRRPAPPPPPPPPKPLNPDELRAFHAAVRKPFGPKPRW